MMNPNQLVNRNQPWRAKIAKNAKFCESARIIFTVAGEMYEEGGAEQLDHGKRQLKRLTQYGVVWKNYVEKNQSGTTSESNRLALLPEYIYKVTVNPLSMTFIQKAQSYP